MVRWPAQSLAESVSGSLSGAMFLIAGLVCSADVAGLQFDINGEWQWLPVTAARAMWAIPAIVLARKLEPFARRRFDLLHVFPILMSVVAYISLLIAVPTCPSGPPRSPEEVMIVAPVVLYVLLFAPFAWLVTRKLRRTLVD